MTADKLDRCREPAHDLDAADGVAVFAVAHQHGLIQRPADEREWEVEGVLYVTADGERAIEKHVPAANGQLERVERATVADADDLEPADGYAAKVAPIVQRHPEV
jgi:hypothetical protein